MPWPTHAYAQASADKADTTGRGIVSAIEDSSRNSGIAGLLTDVKPKQVWIAVLLAVGLGPIGLVYCTITGAIVMLIASVVLGLLLGNLACISHREKAKSKGWEKKLVAKGRCFQA
jgi:hypothetical protein